MKIDQILRKKMSEQNLKQKDVAESLGVTTAAVSKWANGLSYPDITLLPALARLLRIDVNTLLSFHEELSQQEVADFVNQISQIAATSGAEQAFQQAAKMIQQYPTCHLLLLNTAIVMNGLYYMYQSETVSASLAEIEDWYSRAAQSDDPAIRNQANACLINKYMERGEYDKAQDLLDILPSEPSFDRSYILATLYIKQEKWKEAAKLTEASILQYSAHLQSYLTLLAETAILEDQPEAVDHLVKTSQQLEKLLDSPSLTSFGLRLKQAIYLKDQATLLKTLQDMLQLLTTPWSFGQSHLYRHLPNKEMDPLFGKTLLRKLVEDLENSSLNDYDFVKDSPDFQRLLLEMKNRL